MSEHAVPIAVDVARRTGAALRLVLVHEPAPFPIAHAGVAVAPAPLQPAAPATEWERDDEATARWASYLRSVAARGVAAGVPTTTALLYGSVAEAVVTHANAVGVDLIVMATHGRRGVRRLLLGSVAERLVRSTNVPVLLIRPDESRPASGATPRTRRILIALDGTPFSESIIESALEVFGTRDVEYTVVRATTELRTSSRAAGLGLTPDAQVEAVEAGASQARDYLELVGTRLRDRGAAVRCVAPVHVDAAWAILECAAEADVIAMATHGRSGLRRIAHGSVAEHVLRHTFAVVLLHHPPAG